MIFEAAHQMALLPFLALLLVSKRDAAYWWLAGAFGVSWVADSLAHVADPAVVSAIYPITQASLAAAVILHRQEAIAVVFLLTVVGLIALLGFGTEHPDILLHVVAWGMIAGIAWQEQLGPLRNPLLAYFGLGTLAWVWYAFMPGWESWIAYQSTRLLGLLLFTRVIWRGKPSLVLA